MDTVSSDKVWGFRDALIDAIAPLIVLKDTALAALQQVTAEMDERKSTLRYCEREWQDERGTMLDKIATANAEIARLRAEGEAKDRALKVALDAYDAAVRERASAEAVRQDVLGCQGKHPDIGEIMDQVGAEEGCMRAMAARGSREQISLPQSAPCSPARPRQARGRAMAGWTPRPRKWDWRAFLTEDEAAEVAAADKVKAEWQRRQALCAKIQNRAIQRAKYAAGVKSPTPALNREEANRHG